MGIFSSLVDIFTGGSQRDDIQQSIRDQQEGIESARNSYRDYINQQQDLYNRVNDLYSPYQQGGQSAYQELLNRVGLGSNSSNIEQIYSDYLNQDFSSPLAQQLLRQQEEGILRNAAATGGVRGGRTQAALAQVAPTLGSQLLNSRMNLDQQQYNRLGGLAQTGLGIQSSLADLLYGLDARKYNALAALANLDVGSGQVQSGGTSAIAASMQDTRNQAGKFLDELPSRITNPANPTGSGSGQNIFGF